MTELIIAIDQSASLDAYDIIDTLPEQVWYKIGMQLFITGGMDIPVDLMKYEDKRIFLDLKL